MDLIWVKVHSLEKREKKIMKNNQSSESLTIKILSNLPRNLITIRTETKLLTLYIDSNVLSVMLEYYLIFKIL